LLRHALRHFIDHFHTERDHQGKNNVFLFPSDVAKCRQHNRAVCVANASAVYSNTTAVPNEFFDQAGSRTQLAETICRFDLAGRGEELGYVAKSWFAVMSRYLFAR
jgi:hypothetical protein